MITIVCAQYANHGYLRESLEDMIGRHYRDVRAARRAARLIALRDGLPSTPIRLTIDVCGSKQVIDA